MNLPKEFVEKVHENRKNWQRTDEDYKLMQQMVNDNYRDMCRNGEVEYESFANGCELLIYTMARLADDDLDFEDEYNIEE